MMLRTATLSLLLAPTVVGLLASSPAGVRFRSPIARRLSLPVLVASEDAAQAYRLLGLPEDATYEQIWDSYETLSERYAADPARVSSLDSAKDKVLDDRLQQRISGTLGATYEGLTAREDRPVPPKTPLWVHANDLRKKLILVPSPRYAFQVFSILGGLTFATWLAPSTAGSILLINIVSAMGFIYNRGEADVVRDDFGQIGEIRPMKPKPFMFTAAITASFSFVGFMRAKRIVSAMAAPPKGLEGVLRTTLISAGLMIPALLLKVHTIFD